MNHFLLTYPESSTVDIESQTGKVDVFKIQHSLVAKRDMKERLCDKDFVFVETMYQISLLQKIKDEGVEAALEDSFSTDRDFILKHAKSSPKDIDKKIDVLQKSVV